MRDDFKNKLEQYSEGSLPETEYPAFEKELEKIEIYQQYIEEMMGSENKTTEPNQLEKQLVRRGKFKLSVLNVFYTLLGLFGIYYVSLILTNIFYSSGEISRGDRYREALEVSIATTIPNVRGMTSSRSNFPFTMHVETALVRQIGNEEIRLDDLTGSFLFSHFRGDPFPTSALFATDSSSPIILYPPDTQIITRFREDEGFNRLKQLPEGTMAELYISFNEFMTTEEVFQLFQNREMELRWLAVDSGGAHIWDWLPEDSGVDVGQLELPATIGFPYEGYQLRANWTLLESHGERMGLFGLFGPPRFQSWTSEFFEPFSDIERREQEFFEALNIMKSYPQISTEFLWNFDLELVIQHIGENGVQIPGVLVTGPTTELLTLQDEEWIAQTQVGEVTFLNWTSVLPESNELY